MTKTKNGSPDSPPAKRRRASVVHIPATIEEEPDKPAVPKQKQEKHKPKVPSPLGLEALRAAFWLEEKAIKIKALKAVMDHDDHVAFKKALWNAAPYLGGINDPEIRAYVDEYCLRLMKTFIKDSRSQEEISDRINSFVDGLEF
jgi:hypothetical protein